LIYAKANGSIGCDEGENAASPTFAQAEYVATNFGHPDGAVWTDERPFSLT